jgi:hypothetical protein
MTYTTYLYFFNRCILYPSFPSMHPFYFVFMHIWSFILLGWTHLHLLRSLKGFLIKRLEILYIYIYGKKIPPKKSLIGKVIAFETYIFKNVKLVAPWNNAFTLMLGKKIMYIYNYLN